MKPRSNPRGRPAPAALRAAAAALVEKLGDVRAAEAIKIGRNTLARVLGGLPVLNGNIALLEQRFPEAIPTNEAPAKESE